LLTCYFLSNVVLLKHIKVEALRKQVDDQKEKVEVQETELTAKRKELDELKSEEIQLQTTLNGIKKEMETLSASLANSQLQISQYKTKLLHFEEYERQLDEGISELEQSIENKDFIKLNNLVSRPITPPVIEAV